MKATSVRISSVVLVCVVLAASLAAAGSRTAIPTVVGAAIDPSRVVFVTFAKNDSERRAALALAESVRTFGGRWRSARIRVYVPTELRAPDPVLLHRFEVNEVELRQVRVRSEGSSLPYAGKVFAAAQAEIDLDSACDLLIRMDPDTIVLKEPADCILAREVSVGYVPVHQVLIGSPYGQPPDKLWSVVYKRLGISERAVFPVVTSFDAEKIRAYFSAGLVVVRPERKVFRRWLESFQQLAIDPTVKEICRRDLSTEVYLHQVALAGAILATVPRAETVQLPPVYNYPLYLYRATESMERFVTVRYENLFMTPGWSSRVTASAEVLVWLRARFPDQPAR
ncbi:MAG TPA: hypothetical protein VGK32_12120 [Vicinamibacterales bacterium]|jgi:hypothetical protein